MARRKRFTAKDRARIFEAHGGKCYLCGGAIQAGDAWELEHVIPWALTQDDSDENLRLAHTKCHKSKTKNDVADIARAKRREAKHFGFSRPKKKKLQSRGFGYAKKQPLIDKSKLPIGIRER